MSLRERVIPILFASAIGIGSGIYIWTPFLKEATTPEGIRDLELERAKRQLQEPGAQGPFGSGTSATMPTTGSLVTTPERTLGSTQVEASDSQLSLKQQQARFLNREAGETQSVSIWSRLWGSSNSK